MSFCKYTLKGVNGQLAVYENKVEIARKGFLGFASNGLSGTKTIPLKSITSIQVKYGTFWTNGYIQLNTAGKAESTGGMFKATTDENTIFFKKKQNEGAKMIVDFIEQNIL